MLSPKPRALSIAAAVEACRRELHGRSDTPGLDARVLASSVTGLDASGIIAYGDSELDLHRWRRLQELVARRAAGEPVAYIVGHKEFCGLHLRVDRRALVPRPETEELVMAVVEAHRKGRDEILDLGTGCGAIACALAHLLPDARVTATDLSADAIALARENVDALGLADRIELFTGDLFSALPDGRTFDVIAANLPYVAEGDDALEPNVRKHEPPVALFAGRDGLKIYRRFLAEVAARLRPRGALFCECGPANAAQLARCAAGRFAGAAVEIRCDGAGLARFVIVNGEANA